MTRKEASHGGRVLETARRLGVRPEDVLDFSNNAESAAAALTGRLVAETPYPFAFYPDSECAELRAALARHEGLAPEQVLLGNGSSELIHLALAALAPRRALLLTPLFSEYLTGCQRLGIEHELFRLEASAHFRLQASDARTIIEKDFDLLILCSPNNPGSVVHHGLDALLGQLGERARRQGRAVQVLFDSAYREFLYGTPAYDEHAFSRLQAAGGEGVSLLMLMSFTKYFFCPGVRLGYALGETGVIDALRRRQPPWMVPRFAEQLGLKFLESLDEYREVHRALPERRARFLAALKECPAFEAVHPPELNFVLVKLAAGLSGPVISEALAERRILVRVCDDIPGMPPGYLRLQVKSPAENRRLIEALRGLRG
jgi:threonine-phosphate decarboxylase